MDSSRPEATGPAPEVERMIAKNELDPLSTQQVQIPFQNARLRLECNRVRNLSTAAEDTVLRIAPAHESQFSALVVPVLPDGRFFLIGRYRYAVSRWSLEFPRFDCQSDELGWKSIVTWRLGDELGLAARRMTLLGAISADPALISISTIVVLAEDCHSVTQKTADAQQLIAGSLAATQEDIAALVRSGDLICGPTLAALSLLQARQITGKGEQTAPE